MARTIGKINLNQIWIAKGKTTEWIVDHIYDDGDVLLIMNKANSGWAKHSKIIKGEQLLKRYRRNENEN